MSKFKCRRCGHCCHAFTLVAVEPWEADKLGVENVCQDPTESDLQLRKVKGDEKAKGLPAWAVDGTCVFYRKGCTVYKERPGLCKRFTCEGNRFVALAYSVAQGLYCENKLTEEQQHEALVQFMRERPEGK